MSAEEKLRFKFNKKLKIAVGNSKFSNSGRKKVEDTVNESETGKRENYKSSVRDKKFHTAEEGSRGDFDRRKRIYVDRDAAWEANNNAEAPYRKVLSKKGQNQLKYGYINEKNYSRSIYNETNINSEFATSLKSNCPSSGSDDNLSPLDVTSPVFFDNAYYKNLVNNKGLLHSDQQLFSGGATDSQVTIYSTYPSAFYIDFANAMLKMGSLNPLTGSIDTTLHANT